MKRHTERNSLTFYEKIAVIRYYDETNVSRKTLAKMFHCCVTQIRRILRRKDELLRQLADLSETDTTNIIEEMTRKRRKFEMSAIGFILHQWVDRCQQIGILKTITNRMLSDVAIKIARVLSLPSFRPSHRWLNRFREKYKYNNNDLSVITLIDDHQSAIGELSVEDIIIEFKDSLPSFMQNEITAITSSATMTTTTMSNSNGEFDETGCPDDDVTITTDDDNHQNLDHDESLPLTAIDDESNDVGAVANDATQQHNNIVEAGVSTVLSGVFPHLAIIHQFALLNSDVKALELISQLGVHMQTQASAGAYKQLSIATSSCSSGNTLDSDYYSADIDDIVLIE